MSTQNDTSRTTPARQPLPGNSIDDQGEGFRLSGSGVVLHVIETVPMSVPHGPCTRCRRDIPEGLVGVLVIRATASDFEAYQRLADGDGRYQRPRVLCGACFELVVGVADGAAIEPKESA